jgi:hypothetical protein
MLILSRAVSRHVTQCREHALHQSAAPFSHANASFVWLNSFSSKSVMRAYLDRSRLSQETPLPELYWRILVAPCGHRPSTFSASSSRHQYPPVQRSFSMKRAPRIFDQGKSSRPRNLTRMLSIIFPRLALPIAIFSICNTLLQCAI